MGYVSRNLVPGERVLAETWLHWIVYVRPAFWCAASAAALAAGLIVGGWRPVMHACDEIAHRREGFDLGRIAAEHGSTEFAGMVGVVLGLIGVWVGVARLLWTGLRRMSSEFAVTNRRVLLKEGLLASRSLEILLAKVESIYVEQGLLGRLLDYGSLVVIGTGGTKDAYHQMTSPLAFRQAIQQQIAAAAK
jgi:hypothetical protein